jgi:hypothetical protein
MVSSVQSMRVDGHNPPSLCGAKVGPGTGRPARKRHEGGGPEAMEEGEGVVLGGGTRRNCLLSVECLFVYVNLYTFKKKRK